jgi:hypothetical protein
VREIRLVLAADAPPSDREQFLDACARAGCGVVELVDPEAPSADRRGEQARRRRPSEEPPSADVRLSKLSLEDRLAAFLAGGAPVSFGSGARHQEITAALHSLVHSERAGALPILYSDGSQAAGFPVGCLPRVETSAPEDALRLGLMSMRHPELDGLVDGYWFRNKAVSQPRPLADTDAFCFRESRDRLRELHASGIRFIDLYHTGYEPAVIGFYRALVDHQRDEDEAISIRPVFLGDRRYMPGKVWSGANGSRR